MENICVRMNAARVVLPDWLMAGCLRTAWRWLLLCMAGVVSCGGRRIEFEHEKGIWWMPWRQEAMKDVARCENPGGAASRL